MNGYYFPGNIFDLIYLVCAVYGCLVAKSSQFIPNGGRISVAGTVILALID